MPLGPLARDDPEQVAGYRLRGRLGAGGMGRVYLAFTPGGLPVALKVVRPEFGDDPDFRARFRHEVEAARRVHGLYTAQVLDAGPDATPPWLVTAYVAGPSLAQAVREYGPMPPQTVFGLMARVAEALQAIHAAGVVHRDLKPSNVLLAQDGPRVIDFGIARAAEATAVTRTGMLAGSPQYMAPEQIAGETITPAIDVFALGSLAAFAACGRPPFGEGSEAAVLYRIQYGPPDLGSCPEPLRGVIERCLAKEPAERPTPGEVIAACRMHVAGPALEIAQSWAPRPAATRRRSLRAVIAAGAGAVAIAAVAVVTLLVVRSAPAPGLDSCVVGTWKGISATVIGQLGGRLVRFTGPGSPAQTFLPDGTANVNYGSNVIYRASTDGHKWTYVLSGYATFYWTTRDGKIFVHGGKGHGTTQLLENGAVKTVGSVTPAGGSERYSCSADSLRFFGPGGTITLSRVLPRP